MYPWRRLDSGGSPHPHAFVADGSYKRTATVTYENGEARIVSGIRDLVLLKTTDSEFHDYLQDRYTTLKPTTDRVMASAAVIQWLHTSDDVDWSKSYDDALSTLTDVFAGHHSLALQQTAWEMGKALLESQPEIAEMRFSMPNKHHFVIDLSPFGLDNPNEVFHADDRPYGLIEGTVRRDDAAAVDRRVRPRSGLVAMAPEQSSRRARDERTPAAATSSPQRPHPDRPAHRRRRDPAATSRCPPTASARRAISRRTGVRR